MNSEYLAAIERMYEVRRNLLSFERTPEEMLAGIEGLFDEFLGKNSLPNPELSSEELELIDGKRNEISHMYHELKTAELAQGFNWLYDKFALTHDQAEYLIDKKMAGLGIK